MNEGPIRWVRLRSKVENYRTKDGRFLLSPISAPSGPGLPKFTLYKLDASGTVLHDLGSHHSVQHATWWLVSHESIPCNAVRYGIWCPICVREMPHETVLEDETRVRVDGEQRPYLHVRVQCACRRLPPSTTFRQLPPSEAAKLRRQYRRQT